MAGRKIDLYGEAQAANEVQILDHLGLVKRMALHLKVRVPPFIELDELIQAGMLGLMEAAKSFDISKGIPFENFAQIRIKGSMIDEVRRMSYLPRSAVAINKSHSQASNELATRLGREPTRSELAEFMGMDTEDLQKERGDALRFETESIEDMAEEVGNIAGDEGMRPDLIAENTQFMQALEQAIENLPEREKLIIALYYVEELNLKEIGEVVGVSESRVSQILSATAKQLRKTLKVG